MGLIPQPVIEEVLARTDIFETIKQYISLKKAGANFKGLCPFHDENTPSFNVHPGMGIYKCFGCGEGGNVIQFLMKIEGWSFPETVRNLAERAGIPIKEQDPEQAARYKKRRKGRTLYIEIMAAARAYYESMLWSDAGEVARHYLNERGISEEAARAFGLGFAPPGWENLHNHLKKQRFQSKWLQRAGLVNANDRGGFYDRFRNRILFPIIDVWGNTLAFGGRTIAENERGAKYINSPETAFYTKGEQLYGLDVAKREIPKEDFALVVEGNFDVIALYDAGLKATVAPMGTALTVEQARLLKRFARRVFIAFDGDEAGEQATLRCFAALEEAGLEALVIRFDEGDDPDSFIRREGPAALREHIEKAPTLLAWALDRAIRPVEGRSIEARLGILDEIAPLFEQIRDPVMWEHYVREISRRLQIEPAQLQHYLRRPAHAREEIRQNLRQKHKAAPIPSAEYGVLVVLLDQPQWLSDFFREELDKLLTSHELARLLSLAHESFLVNQEINQPLLIESVDEIATRELLTRALAEPEYGELYPPDQSLRWYRDCVWTLKRTWARQMDRILLKELEDLDFGAERERFEELTRELEEVRQFQRALDLEGSRHQRIEGGPT